MTDQQTPGRKSIDIMVAGLERDRRIGWAKAYAAEGQLAETVQALSEATKKLEQLTELLKLQRFTEGALKVLAPSLSPWLAGGDPGLQSFDGVQISTSDDPQENRRAGEREAEIYLSQDKQTRQRRDWRASQLSAWYDDPEARVHYCSCGCEIWNHEGPNGPCIDCECIGYAARIPE